MATSTTNYNLVKPDYNESADIEVINSNMDIIDEALNSLSNRISNTVSDYWNNSTIYEVGQYCIYDNKLWKCLVQHSGQTPTEGTYWTQTSIDKEFTELKGDLGDLIGYDEQFLFSNKYIDGKVYISDNTTMNTTSDCIYPPFTIDGGKTYYYRHLRGFFCFIKDLVTNTVTKLSDNDNSELYGSFTPNNNSIVYIVNFLLNICLKVW